MDKNPIELGYSQNDMESHEESLASSLEHFQNLPEPQNFGETCKFKKYFILMSKSL